MTSTDSRHVPVDQVSADRLASQNLTYRVIDTSSDADIEAFVRADARGFLDADPSNETVAANSATFGERRNIGVFEADAPVGAWPIATVNSWVTPLTIPGGELDMWAISVVTVSGTHRRRGIARALLEGELRSAASAGVPIAGLTASEATIYGRYGFAPAIPVARVSVDTRRAGWIGGTQPGRVEYLDREALKGHLAAVHDVARTQRSGQVPGWEGRWARVAGLTPEHPSPAAIRGVRYLDEHGAVRGVMAYKLTEVPGEFRFEMAIEQLTAVTPEALTALWGFALQHDLVSKVTADLRPVDDPVMWLVADQRAVEFTVHDHGWLRILDVPASLKARSYRAPVDLVLRVVDALGFADGTWRLHVVDGRASVKATSAEADVTADAAALSAMYAGGVTAAQLRAAGRLIASADVAATLDDALRTVDAPLLGIWY